jgi:hypothetical protein
VCGPSGKRGFRRRPGGQPAAGISRLLLACLVMKLPRLLDIAVRRASGHHARWPETYLEHNMNFRTLSIAAALVGVASIASAADGATAPASAASAVKHAAKATGHAISHGASEVATGTEHVASEAATGTAHAAHRAASGVKHAAHKTEAKASDAVTK